MEILRYQVEQKQIFWEVTVTYPCAHVVRSSSTAPPVSPAPLTSVLSSCHGSLTYDKDDN